MPLSVSNTKKKPSWQLTLFNVRDSALRQWNSVISMQKGHGNFG